MKNCRGFSFVEIMVCVVILSTGLLGLLGLQARGLKGNVSANQRTQATLLAYNMIDRMRANTAEAAKGSASLYITTTVTDTTSVDSNCVPTITSGTPGTTCKSPQMAVNDLVQWNSELTRQYCNGATTNTCNGVPLGIITYAAPVFTITISWDDNRNDVVDNRDPATPTNPCYVGTTLPTLSPTPTQFDPCFRTSFQL